MGQQRAVCAASESRGPVSYTHLDVYKRQILLRIITEPRKSTATEVMRTITQKNPIT